MSVKLAQGSFTGSVEDGVRVFHGVPYARQFKRFELPQPPEDSDESFSAREYGPIAPQRPSRLETVMGPFPSTTGKPDEHRCGVLSVYTPEVSAKELRPVMIFIHGGGFVSGTSQTPLYKGVRLARDGGVVVVCINYRLGVLGFLYDEKRSLDKSELPAGTADVILAFEWVQKNIKAFGGNPNNVTAFGQSAGGYHIQSLLDLRPDLFHRAILQSSPANWNTTPEKAKKALVTVEKNLPAGKTVEDAEVKDLLAAEAVAVKESGVEPPFCPTSEAPPGRKNTMTNSKDILLGWTKDDGLVFAKWSQPNANYNELDHSIGDKMFRDPQLKYTEYLKSIGHRATAFELTWAPEGFELGADHCTDLVLVFGDQEAWKNSPMVGKSPWFEWEQRGYRHRQALAKFARDGTVPVPHDGLVLL